MVDVLGDRAIIHYNETKEHYMSKLFTVAGFSVNEGGRKFRVANGGAAARTLKLQRSGHTDIQLVDLPTAMTKEEAFAFVSREGATAAVAMVAKAPKKAAKPVAKTKEVPAEELLEELGIEPVVLPEPDYDFKPVKFLRESWDKMR